MEPRVQRRVQRYGWDLAAEEYERLWQAQLARAQSRLLDCAWPMRGERVLDVACGTGLVSIAAATSVRPEGHVIGVDISERMIDRARIRAKDRNVSNVSFERMGAENLDLPDAAFDVVLCSLGLMYVPDPARALQEMARVLRPGGRVAMAVWGERERCGWSSVFPIVNAETASDVCPLFFSLGAEGVLAGECAAAGFASIEEYRIDATLDYADLDEACQAALIGGPVALAWSRFDEAVRAKVWRRYADSIAKYRHGEGYRIPGEFVVARAVVPATARSPVGSTLESVET